MDLWNCNQSVNKTTTSREQIETNPSKKLKTKIMASGKKVTASSDSINWEVVKREDPEAYSEFHDDDDNLDTLALLRGIHNIQVAGGDGAAEQRFLDRVGFKPLSVTNSAASSPPPPPARGPLRRRETRDQAWSRDEQRRMQSAVARTSGADSPLGMYEGSALSRDVATLTAVVADLDVPGAPPSITLPQAFVSEEAFSAHVEGRVREAVNEACRAFECERQEWARTEAAYRRELLFENRLLEAVLRKYNVSIPDAHTALAELDAADPIEPPVAQPVSPATALSPTWPIERDPSFVRFQTMAIRGRGGRA